MIRIAAFLVVAVLAASNVTWAQTSTAKYAGEPFATGVGGRALAMGGAYAALSNDVTAGYWNPAGLMQMEYPEIGLMHEQRFGGLLSYNYGGVAWPFGPKYSMALTVTRIGVDDIPDTRNAFVDLNGNGKLDDNERVDESKVTMFSSAIWAAYLSYAIHAFKDISLGVNLKLIRHEIAESGAFGVGFDIGAMYRVTPDLTIGANVQDITTTLIAWDTGTNELILPTAKIGAAYHIDAFGGVITPAVDLDIRGESRDFASTLSAGPFSVDPRAGLEYQFKDLFAIRGGYSDIGYWTFGAGVHLPKLYLDYAFGESPLASDFSTDPTHRISIRLQLEEPKFFRKTEF